MKAMTKLVRIVIWLLVFYALCGLLPKLVPATLPPITVEAEPIVCIGGDLLSGCAGGFAITNTLIATPSPAARGPLPRRSREGASWCSGPLLLRRLRRGGLLPLLLGLPLLPATALHADVLALRVCHLSSRCPVTGRVYTT